MRDTTVGNVEVYSLFLRWSARILLGFFSECDRIALVDYIEYLVIHQTPGSVCGYAVTTEKVREKFVLAANVEHMIGHSYHLQAQLESS